MCISNGLLEENCANENKMTVHDIAIFLMTKPSYFNTLNSSRISTPLVYTMRFETDKLRYPLTSEDHLFSYAIDNLLFRWAKDSKTAADFSLHLSAVLKTTIGSSNDIQKV